MAKGSFIKLLCDDDLLYPNCLARQASVLAEARNQDVELVCCQRDIIDARGTRLFTRSGFRRVTGRLPGNVAVRRIVRSGTNLVGEPTATMFRATALEAVGGFDIIEADSLEEAVEIAAGHPVAESGTIEVRPFWGNSTT